MKSMIQFSVAALMLIGSNAYARSIQLPLCTQVAGTAKHTKTGECRSFTNGCQLEELFKAGFQVAPPDTCLSTTEFRTALPHNTSLIPVPDENGIRPAMPSAVTMICDGQSTLRGAFKHTIRLAVITGRALASGGALVEITQTATNAKYAPAAVLANVRETLVGINTGRFIENEAEKFQLFIPHMQVMDTPYLRATIKYGPRTFISRCRTLVY